MKSSFEIAAADETWEGDFQDASEDESDEEAFDGTPDPVVVGNGAEHHPAKKKSKMKRMKVKTERQYTLQNNAMLQMLMYNPKCRGVCCIGTILIVCAVLLVRAIIPESAYASVNQEDEQPQCQVHSSDEPFSEWMHHIRRANDTDLCRSGVRR